MVQSESVRWQAVLAGRNGCGFKPIPRSTILGISIAMLLHVLGTIAVMGIAPCEQLVKSVAPFSDAAEIVWGPWGATAISLAVNPVGHRCPQRLDAAHGQVTMAAARNRLFPPIFSRLSDNARIAARRC